MSLMVKEKCASYMYILTATILTSLSFVSFLFLASSSIFASDHVSNVSVTVPVSCNITSTLDTPHTETINPGQSKADIGTTTFKVFCNDNTGYAIYAIGYSGDEYGNTNMLPTNSATSTNPSIVTGTATSDNTSNWAMKVTPVDGTYAPTIENGFSSYRTVPDTYTKIATFNTNTDFTIGSSFQSTYRVFASQTQPADTYTGKVKYTIVHPNDADPPLQPHAATPKCISYWPNASGVVDSMGDDCGGTSTGIGYGNNTTVNALWASNFRRDGYGFAGWSDKFDWVLNENDEDGNGTGPNEGYRIYGPNQSITTPANMTEKGLSIYAVWIPAQGTLQNWNGCPAMNIGEVTALKDARDHNAYAVAKLKDGNCWIIENLRLDSTAELTTTNTNNPLNNAGTVTIKNSDGNTTNHLSVSTDPATTAWCTNTNAACYDQSMIFTGNTTSSATQMTGASANIYSYGNYYNWYSATAGNGTYSFNTNNNSVNGSICPAGWHLPKGGNKTRIEANDDNEFWNLAVDSLNNGTLPAKYYATYPYYTGFEATGLSNALRSFPNNFVYSGEVYGSSIRLRSTGGRYWSSTADDGYSKYYLYFGSSVVYPGTSRISDLVGLMARCVLGS